MLTSAVTCAPFGFFLGLSDLPGSGLKWFLLGFHQSSLYFLSWYLVSKLHREPVPHPWPTFCLTLPWMCCSLSLLPNPKSEVKGLGVQLLVNQWSNEAILCSFLFSISSWTRIINKMLHDLWVKKGIIRQINYNDYNDYWEQSTLIINSKDSAQRQRQGLREFPLFLFLVLIS